MAKVNASVPYVPPVVPPAVPDHVQEATQEPFDPEKTIFPAPDMSEAAMPDPVEDAVEAVAADMKEDEEFEKLVAKVKKQLEMPAPVEIKQAEAPDWATLERSMTFKDYHAMRHQYGLE